MPSSPARRRSLAALAAVFAVALAVAPTSAEEPRAVAFRFAWPERAEGKRIEKRPQGAAERRSALRVERKGEETFLQTLAAPEEEAAAAADGEGQDSDGLPVVAGKDGRFQRLDGLEKWAEERASFDVSVARSKAEADAARTEAKESAARLEAEAREQWSYQVEAWIGRSIVVGERIETTGRLPIGAVPGLEVEQRVALAARRWVSCAPGGLDHRCLELTLKADAGPDAFRKGLAAAGGKAAKGFEDGSLAVEVVLVTDPETLLPWRYSITKKLRLVFAGRGLSVDQVERKEREYQWWKGT